MEKDMGLTLEKTKAVIGRFAIIFPPPTPAGIEDLAGVWMSTLSDCEEVEVMNACKKLIRTLTRFPYPADVLALVNEANEDTARRNA